MPNTRLVVILVAIMAIAVAGSLFGFFRERITGYATSAGTVYVRVLSLESITVTSNVYFGNGTISNTPPYTEMSTEASDNPGTFNNCSMVNGGTSDNDVGRDCSGMQIENDGNVYVNVTFYAGTTIANFFESTTDTGAGFRFAVLDGNRTKNETAVDVMGYYFNPNTLTNNASCYRDVRTNHSIRPQGSYLDGSFINWTSIPEGSGNAYLICGNLSFINANDTITVEFNITIPPDEPTGLKTNQFTFTATEV